MKESGTEKMMKLVKAEKFIKRKKEKIYK